MQFQGIDVQELICGQGQRTDVYFLEMASQIRMSTRTVRCGFITDIQGGDKYMQTFYRLQAVRSFDK